MQIYFKNAALFSLVILMIITDNANAMPEATFSVNGEEFGVGWGHEFAIGFNSQIMVDRFLDCAILSDGMGG